MLKFFSCQGYFIRKMLSPTLGELSRPADHCVLQIMTSKKYLGVRMIHDPMQHENSKA